MRIWFLACLIEKNYLILEYFGYGFNIGTDHAFMPSLVKYLLF